MVKTKSQLLVPVLQELPREMPTNQLPTNRSVLLRHLFLQNNAPPNVSFNTLKYDNINRVLAIYNKVPQPIITRKRVEEKLKTLLLKFREAKKGKLDNPKAIAFCCTLDELFDISA